MICSSPKTDHFSWRYLGQCGYMGYLYHEWSPVTEFDYDVKKCFVSLLAWVRIEFLGSFLCAREKSLCSVGCVTWFNNDPLLWLYCFADAIIAGTAKNKKNLRGSLSLRQEKNIIWLTFLSHSEIQNSHSSSFLGFWNVAPTGHNLVQLVGYACFSLPSFKWAKCYLWQRGLTYVAK